VRGLLDFLSLNSIPQYFTSNIEGDVQWYSKQNNFDFAPIFSLVPLAPLFFAGDNKQDAIVPSVYQKKNLQMMEKF
jgi:hypothetical protein